MMENTKNENVVHVSLHLRPLDLEMSGLYSKVVSRRQVAYTGCWNYNLEILEQEKDKWKEIMCIPHSYIVNKKMTDIQEREILKMMESHCRKAFGKPLATKDYKIINVSKTLGSDVSIFQPLYDDEWVYISKSEIIKYDYDFTPFIGLGYIGDDPLYVFSSYDFDGALWVRDYCLYDLSDIDLLSQEVIDDRLLDIDSRVKLLRDSGFISYTNGPLFDIVKSIASDWNIAVNEVTYPRYEYYSKDSNSEGESLMSVVNTTFLMLQSIDISSCVFSGWLDETVLRILIGRTPRVMNCTKGTPLPGGIYSLETESLPTDL